MEFERALHSTAMVALMALAQFAAAPLAHAAPPQRVIIKYRAPATDAGATNAQSQAVAEAGRRIGVGLQRVRRTAIGAEVLRTDRHMSRAELDTLVRSLAANPDVEYAEEDRLMQRVAVPNDPRFNEQWDYFESAAGINAPAAWNVATGAGVTVAVIDTGYRSHADLAANIVGGYDFISEAFVANDGGARDNDGRDPGDWTNADDCGAGSPAEPSSWHGTHVAGTIAAVSNNGVGVAGVAYNAKVLPVRVLGRCGGYISDIADAVVWASGGTVSGVPVNTHPAKIINMSLGGGGNCDITMQVAINSARDRGTAVVVAAGNGSSDALNTAPANCAGVITVGAVTRNGERAFYSNFGSVVDLSAPGGDASGGAGDILSTLNTGTTTPAVDTYARYAGTSMAAPHVSGVAALMLEVNSALTPDQIESLLKSTARPFPVACSDCGTGILDAAAAVAAAPSGQGSCPLGYTRFTGTLSRGTPYAFEPGPDGYSVTGNAVHVAQLLGPSTADFDLRLQKKNSSGWRSVKIAETSSSTESITYNGTAGDYRWWVYSYNGAGDFQICIKH